MSAPHIRKYGGERFWRIGDRSCPWSQNFKFRVELSQVDKKTRKTVPRFNPMVGGTNVSKDA